MRDSNLLTKIKKKKVSLTSWDVLAVSGLMMWDNIYFVTEVTVTGEHMGNPINWLTKFTSQKLAVGASCNWVSFNFRCPLIDAENHWYFLSQWSSRFLGLKQVCTGLLLGSQCLLVVYFFRCRNWHFVYFGFNLSTLNWNSLIYGFL